MAFYRLLATFYQFFQEFLMNIIDIKSHIKGV